MKGQGVLFGGATYDPVYDEARLSRQLAAVRAVMIDGEWRTLREIADRIGGAPEASVSARLRDLRKPQFGAYRVERRSRGHRARGLYEYRIERP